MLLSVKELNQMDSEDRKNYLKILLHIDCRKFHALDVKEERFCKFVAYYDQVNNADAWIIAGYSKKNAKQNAYSKLKKKLVREYVNYLGILRTFSKDIDDKERIWIELKRIAFSRPDKYQVGPTWKAKMKALDIMSKCTSLIQSNKEEELAPSVINISIK
jgi:hypothetical protein